MSAVGSSKADSLSLSRYRVLPLLTVCPDSTAVSVLRKSRSHGREARRLFTLMASNRVSWSVGHELMVTMEDLRAALVVTGAVTKADAHAAKATR